MLEEHHWLTRLSGISVEAELILSSATGKVLWTHQTGANVGAPPMSYAVKGRQFVAVVTGAAPGPGGPGQPGAIRVFALLQ